MALNRLVIAGLLLIAVAGACAGEGPKWCSGALG
ncbi:hypothetical protein ABIB48_000049 [Arthrobacter sp. UYCu511]